MKNLIFSFLSTTKKHLATKICRTLLLLLLTVVLVGVFVGGYWIFLEHSNAYKLIEYRFQEISRRIVPQLARNLLYGDSHKVSFLLGQMIQTQNLLFAEIRHERKQSLTQHHTVNGNKTIVRSFALEYRENNNTVSGPVTLYVGISKPNFYSLLIKVTQPWHIYLLSILLGAYVGLLLYCRWQERVEKKEKTRFHHPVNSHAEK